MNHFHCFPRLWASAALVIAAVSLPVPLAAQRGARVEARNLGELVSQSATIVRGSVVSAKVERHPELSNLSTVAVTIRVSETLKGEARESFTFRQFIWDIRDRYDAGGYRKGQELLLLMNPSTRYGLTSPAGLEQGRFRITRDGAGREVVANGLGNVGLFNGLSDQLKGKHIRLGPHASALINRRQPGPIALQDFRELVLQLGSSQAR